MIEHVWTMTKDATFNSPLIPFLFLSGWTLLMSWFECRDRKRNR